jgi:hypothetical protein
MAKQIVTSPFERHDIMFVTSDGNQNRHTGDLVQHAGIVKPVGEPGYFVAS